MIFKLEPKKFPTPADPVGYTITGVSCRTNINEIGAKDTISCTFTFYTQDAAGTWFAKDIVDREVKREAEVPGLGKVPILSMLVSPKRSDIYKGASLMAGAYGFKLLPIGEQTDLVSDDPATSAPANINPIPTP